MHLAPLVALVLLFAPTVVRAVTLRDIVELSKAGVSDVVLTALIDADRTMFVLDAQQVLELRAAGVSDAVILKMIQSRREFEPPAIAPVSPSDTGTLVIVGDTPPEATQIVPVVVPYYVPVLVPVDTTFLRDHPRHSRPHRDGDQRTDRDATDKDTPARSPSVPPMGLRIRNGEFVR